MTEKSELFELEPSRLTISQDEMAEQLGVTSRSLRNWPDCPRERDGSYDPGQVLRWYLARRREQTPLQYESARLARARAERAEDENEKRRGQLLDAATISAAWAWLIGQIEVRTLKMADEGATAIVGLPVPRDRAMVEAILTVAVYDALKDLARGELDPAALDLPNAPG